jgi:hypothetical protein
VWRRPGGQYARRVGLCSGEHPAARVAQALRPGEVIRGARPLAASLLAAGAGQNQQRALRRDPSREPAEVATRRRQLRGWDRRTAMTVIETMAK